MYICDIIYWFLTDGRAWRQQHITARQCYTILRYTTADAQSRHANTNNDIAIVGIGKIFSRMVCREFLDSELFIALLVLFFLLFFLVGGPLQKA